MQREPVIKRMLERVPNRLNWERALDSLFGRIFCGKPVSTFPENALPTLLVMASIGTTIGSLALADNYPSRPVKVVVPFAAGGPLDVVARAVSDKLSASLKQPFVIENRAGAGGNIGTEVVARAAPDGYTLLMVLATTLTANPSLYKKLPFDPNGICGRCPSWPIPARCWSCIPPLR
jgi:hypothetical protein